MAISSGAANNPGHAASNDPAKMPLRRCHCCRDPLQAPRSAKPPSPTYHSAVEWRAARHLSCRLSAVCDQLLTMQQHSALASACLARLEVEGFDANDGEGGKGDRKGQKDADNLHDITDSRRC